MVFLIQTRLCSSEELGALLLLEMAAVSIRGALIFTVNITGWLQSGSLSWVAQSLHLTSVGFLASTTGLWAFLVQILNVDKHKTLPWALGHWLDLWITLPWTKPLAGLVWNTDRIQALSWILWASRV